MPVFDESGDRFRLLVKGAYHAKNTDTHVELPEDAEQAPDADVGTVFEGSLKHWAAQTLIRWKPDIVQHVVGTVVAFKQRSLASSFEIQVDIDRNARLPGANLDRAGWPHIQESRATLVVDPSSLYQASCQISFQVMALS